MTVPIMKCDSVHIFYEALYEPLLLIHCHERQNDCYEKFWSVCYIRTSSSVWLKKNWVSTSLR